MLTDAEFIEVCNEVNGEAIAKTIGDLVQKGAVNMGINEDGEIVYSANKNFDINEL